jgi:hypothetical protein
VTNHGVLACNERVYRFLVHCQGRTSILHHALRYEGEVKEKSRGCCCVHLSALATELAGARGRSPALPLSSMRAR